MNIFEWKVNNETKKILGYVCQRAVTHFRGRKYEAWFTTQLPQGGPWKYDGLPGMILEIKSEQPMIEFKAVAISSQKVYNSEGYNRLKTDEYLTWDEFKSLYKKKAIELSNYNPDKGLLGGIILQRIGIERYIADDDNDYKADKEFEKQTSN